MSSTVRKQKMVTAGGRKSSGITSRVNEFKLYELNHKLSERIKELNCLYGISKLVEQRHKSIDETLQDVVNLIPPSWQYPEVTCARIKLRNHQIQTANFRETTWKQAEEIIVNGEKYGSIEVYYL